MNSEIVKVGEDREVRRVGVVGKVGGVGEVARLVRITEPKALYFKYITWRLPHEIS
jgi:hypothetical protein